MSGPLRYPYHHRTIGARTDLEASDAPHIPTDDAANTALQGHDWNKDTKPYFTELNAWEAEWEADSYTIQTSPITLPANDWRVIELTYLISGFVTVRGQPAERDVIAISATPDAQGNLNYAGETRSANDGSYQISSTEPTVYAIALDDWGEIWQAGLIVTEGQIVHPTRGKFNGFIYKCTSAGIFDLDEPDWWVDYDGSTGPQPVGTALMQAIQMYRPQAEGPITGEIEV